MCFIEVFKLRSRTFANASTSQNLITLIYFLADTGEIFFLTPLFGLLNKLPKKLSAFKSDCKTFVVPPIPLYTIVPESSAVDFDEVTRGLMKIESDPLAFFSSVPSSVPCFLKAFFIRSGFLRADTNPTLLDLQFK